MTIAVQTADFSVSLSRDETWTLFVSLGGDAPFVRHQLSVIRGGGHGSVSLSTPQERRDVFEALQDDRIGRPLTEGLLSLRAALAGAVPA